MVETIVILVLYFGLMLFIGWAASRKIKSSRDYILGGKGFGHVSTHRMSGHEAARDLFQIEHATQHVGHEFHRMHFRFDLRDAVSGDIDGENSVVRGEQFGKILPYFERLQIAVQQDQYGFSLL